MGLRNKIVLVTGGAGFIGSHLVDALILEHPEKIIVIDNYSLGNNDNLSKAIDKYHELYVEVLDLSDFHTTRGLFLMCRPDVVFNLAIVPLPASLVYPYPTFRTNTDITLNICEFARLGMFDTLIHFSSSEVYGTNVSNTVPMNEEHPLNGTTPYAASKAASDLLVLSYARTFGIDTSIIRPFNNYGPRQNSGSYAGIIPSTINRVLNGKKPIICGDGFQTRDYLYVTDTANAAISIYKKTVTRGKVLNVASGKEISVNTLVGTISHKLGYMGDYIIRQERPGDVRRHIANIYRAEDLIGFKPTVTFVDGIQQTVDWYKEKHT
jgi:UDP-glucose 4-epimerase